MGEVRGASVVWIVVSIAFGWTLFIYWWGVVLIRSDLSTTLYMLAVVLLVADALLIGTFGWVAHNRKLARRGSRGRATAYRPPRYERDAVQRTVILPQRLQLQSAPVLRVVVQGDRKIFEPLPGMSRSS